MRFERDYSVAYISRRGDLWKSLETVLVTVVFFLLARYINPEDPFSLKGPFPWLLFVPVFCSLFYSTIYGIASLLILLAFLVIGQQVDLLADLQVRHYVAGGFGLTLLTGIFSSSWVARVRHIEHLNGYVREHLESLSRDYYLLRISHERIEQSYIIKPLSFRDAFIQINQEIVKNNCEINPACCEAFLNIFSQYCSVNNAAFYLYNEESEEADQMAVIGKNFYVNTEDPLIKQAIKGKLSTYVDVSHLRNKNQSDYLAVIPLINLERKIKGFAVIKEMPFWSLTHDNLEVLGAFAAYFTLKLLTFEQAAALIQEFPTCPPEFLNELQTLVRLKKSNNVNSSLSCIIVPPNSQQQNIAYILERQKRSMDYVWVHSVESSILIITLMPLTGLEGMIGYKNRVEGLLKNDFGLTFNGSDLHFRFQPLNQKSEEIQLQDFIEEAIHAIQ